jgi:hypothetical protein
VQRRIAGRLAIVALIGAVVSCHSPTAPITGQDAVTVIDVVPASGGIQMGAYVVAHLQIQVTSDLEVPTVGLPASYQIWVCLSVDGIHFAADCNGVSGAAPGIPFQCAVPAPTARPTQTNYVLAFIIKTSDYDIGHPLAAGGMIPASALAKDVKPWVINWQ